MFNKARLWLKAFLPAWLYGLVAFVFIGGLILGTISLVTTLATFSGWLFWVLAACALGVLIGRGSDTRAGRRIASVLICVAIGLLPQVLFLAGFNMAVNTGESEPLTMSSLLALYEKGVIFAHEKLDVIAEPPLQWTAFGAAVIVGFTLIFQRVEIALRALYLNSAVKSAALCLVAASSVTAFTGLDTAGWSPNLRYRLEARLREKTQYIMEQNYAAALIILAQREPGTIAELAERMVTIAKAECSQSHWMMTVEEAQLSCVTAATASVLTVRELHQVVTARATDYGAANYDQIKAQISDAVIDTGKQRVLAETMTEMASSSVRTVIGRYLSRIAGRLLGDFPLFDAFVQEFLEHIIHGNAKKAAAAIPYAHLGDWLRYTMDKPSLDNEAVGKILRNFNARMIQFRHPVTGQFLLSDVAIKEARVANQAMRFRFLLKSWRFTVKWAKKTGKFVAKEHIKL